MSRSKHPLVTVLLASLFLSALAWFLGRSLSGELGAVELAGERPAPAPAAPAEDGGVATLSKSAPASPLAADAKAATRAEANRASTGMASNGMRLRLRLAARTAFPDDEHIVVRYAPTRGGLARGATVEPDADGRFEIEVVRVESTAPMDRIRGSRDALDEPLLRNSLDQWTRTSSERSTTIVVNGEHLDVVRTDDGQWVIEDPSFVLDELGRVPVGEGSQVWIDIEARYVYLHAPLRVSVPASEDADRETTILAEVGARLTGQLEGGRTALELASKEGPDLEVLEHRGVGGRAPSSASQRARRSISPLEGKITVDEHGYFDHGPVPSGDDLVVALSSDVVQPFESPPFRLLPGETQHIVVPVRDGVLVDGTLLSDTGAELAMYTVRARIESLDPDRSLDPEGHATVLSTRTDRQGRFELAGLPPGVVTLELDSPHMMARSLELGPLQDGESRTGLELRARLAGRIAGTLFDVDGTVRASTAVGAYVSGSEEPVVSTFTDSEGRFVLQGLKELDYEVRATASSETFGHVAAVRPARVGATGLDLHLNPDVPESDD